MCPVPNATGREIASHPVVQAQRAQRESTAQGRVKDTSWATSGQIVGRPLRRAVRFGIAVSGFFADGEFGPAAFCKIFRSWVRAAPLGSLMYR